LGDLHLPIKLDEEFQDVFGKIDTSISGLNSEWKYSKADIHKSRFPEFKENRIKLYDAKLRQTDSLVRDIVSKISELSTRDTLFVITADHGEEFWDHAKMENQYFHSEHDDFGVGHGYNLFQEIIHVPLILYSNSMHSGVSTENVSLVDVTPTILEQLSINHQIPVDGTSLFKKREKNVIFSEGVRARLKKKAVIKGDYKLIVSEANDVSLLFNLKEDPLESTPLDNPRLENELKCEFPDAPTNLRKEKLQSDVIKERLNELGYF
jgi:arylsulfatase A-like enzyme